MSQNWILVKERNILDDLIEKVWKIRVGNSPFDIISIHKVLLKDKGYGGGSILILPGTWSSGEQLVSLSWNGVRYAELDVKKMLALYLAKNGYSVYTVDYRTHYVPPYFKGRELSFMKNWGWNELINDIKLCVKFIKNDNKEQKIILAGESFGAGAALNFSVSNWKEDVKALILLDGGPIKTGVRPRFYEPEVSSIEEMDIKGIYAIPSRGGPNNPIWAYALANPDMPSPDPRFGNLAEYLMFMLYSSGSANPYSYPYSKKEDMFPILASFDPYWPYRLGLEISQGLYSFKERYKEIKVPTIAFISERFGANVVDTSLLPINSEFVLLKGYGHLDVYTGDNVEKDVNKVVLKWISEHL
ncbi:MAG: alpha/beta fold hydrolase [Sulfolobaceae archaeon]